MTGKAGNIVTSNSGAVQAGKSVSVVWQCRSASYNNWQFESVAV